MSDKPFLSYEELVVKLRDEKELCVSDEAHVISLLKKHGYFYLVTGYKAPFKRPDGSGKYMEGTTIDDLLALFEFDNNLRDIFFHSIQIIEKHIKSLLSHYFCEKYGDDQKEYLNPMNYNFIVSNKYETYRKSAEVKRLTQMFHNIVTPPFDELKYIEHQYRKHKNIPLWVSIKALTLGSTSKMYSLCFQTVQCCISKEFDGINEGQLSGMLDFLTRVRNVCAHNERLYNFSSRKRGIRGVQLHKQLDLKRVENRYTQGQNDLFAAVICFYYLLSPQEFSSAIDSIHREINTLCEKTNQISRETILDYMHFPDHWYEQLVDLNRSRL